jgi:hypothetical protein
MGYDAWTREIEVCIPVSDPAVWENSKSLLRTILNFLTGDKWDLQFRERPVGRSQLAVPTENLRTANPDCVCLFSGGLDSFIGAIDLFSAGESPLLVSHYWDGITSSHQTICADALKTQSSASEFSHVRARVGNTNG